MPVIGALTTFTANTRTKAAEVNANFSAVRTTVNTYGVFIDVACSISAVYTFNAVPVFALGVTITAGGLSVGAGGVTITAGGLSVTAGGVTITAGGLTVSASGATITGNSSITGTLSVSNTCTAATFSGSGAGLTSLPAATLTGTLPAISGANLTALNGSNITSGTVAEGRITSSFTALTITTLTGTTAVIPTIQGAASTPKNTLALGDASTLFLSMTAQSKLVAPATGAADALSFMQMPYGTTMVTDSGWIQIYFNTKLFYIPFRSFT